MATTSKAASFVARIWLESGPNGDPSWRGHVQHVQSSRAAFFEDLRALQTFVEGVSGITGPALGAKRRGGTRLPPGAGRVRKTPLARSKR